MVGQMGPHEKLRTVNTAGWALCTKSGGELCDPTLNYPLETCSLMGPTKSTKHQKEETYLYQGLNQRKNLM